MATRLKKDEKRCPDCAETIKAAAVRCRFCGADVSATGVPAAASEGPEAAPQTREPTGPTGPTGLTGPSGPSGPPEDEEEPRGPDAEVAELPVTRRSARSGGARPPLARSLRLTAVLAVLAVLAAIAFGYAWWRSEHPADGQAPNGVITSATARDEGMQKAGELSALILSYNWSTLDADTKKAAAVTTPSFRAQYLQAMGKVKTQTLKNQVKLQATPVASSIVSASKDTVVALVFVDQQTTAKDSPNRQLDANRVLVTMTRSGGDWRVSDMKAF